jgi:queuosine precursor transporter
LPELQPVIRSLPFIAYIATIFAANWAITTFGLVPVGFGLLAPAGVYFAGLAFTFRDLTQDTLGRRWTYGAIVIGAGLSALLSGPLALASGTAFLVSETADLLVYTPLRRRHWLGAVALSNTVGVTIDSALFLWLAFGSLMFLAPTIVGKLEATLFTIAVLWAWRALSQRSPEPVST